MTFLDTDSLLQTAKERTHLTDFGGEEFVEGLRRMLNGINHSSYFRNDRSVRLAQEILRLLMNRLRTVADIQQHPSILDQQLQPPVCICSLPRTGTTKLHRLLGASGMFQALAHWQVYMPARIPGMADGGREERFRQAEEYCAWEAEASPEFKKAYPRHVAALDEELQLMEPTFNDVNHGLTHGSPEYLTWLANQDNGTSYDYLLRELKYLQWQFYREDPKPWILKTPGHLGHEGQLTRIFPQGINFIFSHRDPKEIIASLCHLVESSQALYYVATKSREQLGQEVVGWFASSLQKHIEWRDRNPQCDVIDLAFKDIIRDSVGVVSTIAERIGRPLVISAINRIREWDEENPRDKHGKREFTLDMFGLDAQRVDDHFASYINRFSSYF